MNTKKQPVTFQTAAVNPDWGQVYDVDAQEVAKLVTAVHIVDVRRPEEYTGELGHISNSRLLILDELPERISELPKDEPIVFVCRSGARSGRAAAFAHEQGFEHVYNMKGGMLLWNECGLPIEQ